jgi:hypothetical protein
LRAAMSPDAFVTYVAGQSLSLAGAGKTLSPAY